MLAGMVRKLAAALLIALTILPFTAPFPAFSFGSPPAATATAPIATDTPCSVREMTWSAGCSNLLRHKHHALHSEIVYGTDRPMFVDARGVLAVASSPRDSARHSTVLRI
jgi:hypothetical protein